VVAGEPGGLKRSLTAHAALLSELLTQRIEPIAAKNGISLGSFEILSAVHAAGNRASQADIARALGITPPSLCESIKTCVKQGVLEQQEARRDRRAKRLVLTPLGRRILRNVLRAVEDVEADVLAGLEPGEVDRAIATLQRASRNLAASINLTS